MKSHLIKNVFGQSLFDRVVLVLVMPSLRDNYAAKVVPQRKKLYYGEKSCTWSIIVLLTGA